MRSLRSLVARAIRAAERTLKMDVRYLARGTFWGTVAQAASILSALALSVVMARYVPKEAYGEYKFILSIVSVLPLLSLTGMGGAVLQSVSRGFDGSLAEAFRMNLRWSFAIFLGTLAAALYYFSQGNQTLGIGILIGGSLSPLITSASLASSFLTAKKDFYRLAIYSGVLGTIIPAASLIVTALLTHNVIAFVAVYFVSNLATDLLLYWLVLRAYRPDPANRDPGLASYAKHLGVIGIINGIAGNLDQILLFHFVGPAQLAVYNFAIGIPDQIKGPLKNLDGMLQSRFAIHLPQNIRENMNMKMLALLAFAVVVIALYIPLAPFFFHLLYPAYVEAIPYSQIYMLSYLALPLFVPGSYLTAKKLVREQYISSVLVSIFQIVTMVIGVIGWGLWGLMWSVLATRLFTGALWYILYLNASRKEIV